MNLKRTKKIIVTLASAVLLAACSGSEALVDPTVMLAYGMDPSAQNSENLMKSYGSAINKNRKSGKKTPGVYSDYAVTLVKAGRRAEANNWFNKEMDAFPSSRGYVLRLKRELIPEYANDNTISSEEASEEVESSLPPATRAAAEERAATVMDETNREMDAENGAVQEETAPAAEETTSGDEEEVKDAAAEEKGGTE